MNRPRVLIPTVVYGGLLGLLPHWDGTIEGPVPLGQSEPYRIQILGILRPDRAGAEEALRNHAQAQCAAHSYVYLEDEWTIVDLRPVNQN